MAEMLNTDPVTATFRGSEWHALCRDMVHVATFLERMIDALENSADPKRDAWVLACTQQLRPLVDAADACAELLMEAQARPVPTMRR